MDYLQTILGLFSTTLNNPLIIYKPYIYNFIIIIIIIFWINTKKETKTHNPKTEMV